MTPAPIIGPQQGKRWGSTRCVYSHNNCEIWDIDIRKGGCCSEHYHNHKWNRFVIFSGKLKVTIFLGNPDEPVPDAKRLRDETILSSGDCTDVPPGVWHVFEALEDVKGIEVYWTALDSDDIIRRTTGGMNNDSNG